MPRPRASTSRSGAETVGTQRYRPTPAGLDVLERLDLGKHCVARDAYDEAAFDCLLAGSPALKDCARRGEARLRSFPALLSDIFCLLFKLRPALVDRARVRPAFQVNRHLIARLAEEPQVKDLRIETPLDEAAAGAGTFSVASRLLDEIGSTSLADENALLELEETINEGGTPGEAPAGVRRLRPRASVKAGGAGEEAGPGGESLAYDLQQKLEMAETLKGFRSFERLLVLARELTNRLASDDPTQWQATEVYDTGLGSEVSRLLPSELLFLLVPSLKRDFLRRLLERQLLTYQIRGREFRGPLVILVDVSHSMAGEKEFASKALAIALSDVALGRGQPVSAILFGPRTASMRQVDFRSQRSRGGEIAAVAGTFFGGGTDFERPISAAIEQIASSGREGGHIVFISDGLCQVDEAWLSTVLAEKARRRIEILSIFIDLERCSHEALASFSDRIVRWSELVGDGENRRGRAPPRFPSQTMHAPG